MIFDKIEHAQRYLGISPNMDTALRYMMETDLSALADGKHVIDGDAVFVNVMQATTRADKDEYEFHEEYYDIQIDLTGAEDVLFSTAVEKITRPYQPDIGLGLCTCEAVCHLAPGRFVVCEPTEPHLPGVAAGGQEADIRKAVIKVHK